MIERGEGTRSPLTAFKHPTTGIETRMKNVKIGDRCQWNGGGDVYEVSGILPNGRVTWKGFEPSINNDPSSPYIVWLPRATKAKPARYAGISDYILLLCEKGHYKPAPEPRVYTTKRQALRVAKEMAKKHGGTFVVFKAVANAVMPTTEPTVTEF